MSLREKLMNIYDYIQDSALYKNSKKDIILGSFREVQADIASGVKVKIPEEEAYNSVPLFTLLTCALKNANMMYCGYAGIGKTTCAEYMGYFVYYDEMMKFSEEVKKDPNIRIKFKPEDLFKLLQAAEINCNPEQTEEKMYARFHTGQLVKGEEDVLVRFFCRTPVHILDEINRLTPGRSDNLYNAIDRRFILYGDEHIELREGPLFATANYKDAGNFIMTTPFLDRFDVAVMVTEPSPGDLIHIMQRPNAKLGEDHKIKKELLAAAKELRITAEEREAMRSEIRKVVFFDEEYRDVINLLCSVYSEMTFCANGSPEDVSRRTKGVCSTSKGEGACRGCHYIDKGSNICRYSTSSMSIRSIINGIQPYAMALAWFRGHDKVTREDLKTVIPYTLWHKLDLNTAALSTDDMKSNLNDRINLVKSIVEKLDTDLKRLDEKLIGPWGAVLDSQRQYLNGEITEEKLKTIEENAALKMSNEDTPTKEQLIADIAAHHYDTLVRSNKKKKKKEKKIA